MKNNGLNNLVDEESSLEESSPEQRVYIALAAVPSGTVVTYGQLAELAGLPRAARMVGRILGNLPNETQLPWHRVVNATGEISLPENSPSFKTQKARLQEEGVVLTNNRVSLKKFNWQP
jgi:methylated-DNA-protein-cysteine methyltransferase related protein